MNIEADNYSVNPCTESTIKLISEQGHIHIMDWTYIRGTVVLKIEIKPKEKNEKT